MPPAATSGDVVVHQVAVGDELLCGRTSDTNSREVQRSLLSHGLSFQRVTVVPDDAAAIAEALSATPAGALVIVTGGLGSTPDDVTREAVAAWAGVPLVRDHTVAARLEEFCRTRSVRLGQHLARQALHPEGLSPLLNPVGTAPALVGPLAGRLFVLLPGVPAELRALLPLVRDWLAGAGHPGGRRPTLLLRTAQAAESTLVELCRPLLAPHAQLRWSWWQSRWGVDLGVSASGTPSATEALATVTEELRRLLGLAVYAHRPRELNEVVVGLLSERGQTVGVAESCTGGQVGARLTDVAGASACFQGGFIVYADEIKRGLLGVAPDLLATHGAVSRPVAEAMARGCRQRLAVDLAVAVTGIAGPSGGSEQKPVGTTWIAIAGPEATFAHCYRFSGTRARNRGLATAAALDLLRRQLTAPQQARRPLTTDTWACGAED
jgi:nicotinamide-nucleotide amidase